jgi:hypothetical protein
MCLGRSAAVFAALISSIGVAAQAQSTSRAGLVPIPYRTYIGLNPTIVPLNLGSVEIESGIAQGMTIGGALSYTEFDDHRWTSADAKFRYYPSEVVLRGFSLGLTAGFLHYSTPVLRGDPGPQTREKLDAPTIGFELDHNLLLGGNKRFLIGTGVGAKRLLASREDRERVHRRPAYVTGRFIVGLAF